ncbi:MAG: 2-oxoacid:acceptor oxidoreductase subunit alpha, partial [Deltaproteobacteria bacterium]|nr:2-oxoacid:acceptor oxidoreductase subunit alpha [Deltaproteobacteria bacterium]
MNNTILNILIGGAAGQGLQTVGPILAKGLVRKGFSVHVKQEYESRVRGGHNVFALRTGAKKVSAPCDRVDILVCLNKETFHIHQDELADNALVIFDQDWGIEYQRKIIIPLDLPGEKITRNSAAAAVLAGLIGIDKNTLTGVYKDSMGEKKAYKNMVTIDAAFAWLYENRIDFSPLPQIENPQSNLLLTGHEALAIGAVSAGIKFCSYYPMSPATSITQTLVNYAERMGLVIEQVEDEIAAINMALGASFAGAPSLVATSGGGFALMAEGVSLAGISETPIVIVIGQRPGPGTGLPTRTEQADLLFALYSSHGEFPRVIYAPADVEQCFHLARKAVFTAERYQLPAFVLTDQYVAESFQDMKPVDMEKLDSITKPGAGASSVMLPYARYRITESGISPRLIPGLSENLVIGDSHEHTETGHMTEDLALR